MAIKETSIRPTNVPKGWTDRENDILLALYRSRALTTKQVEALCFPPGKYTRCGSRLRFLWDSHYVLRDAQPAPITGGREPLVYWLNKQGADAVAELLATRGDAMLVRFERTAPKDEHLAHFLATNDVQVRFVLALRDHGGRLLTWHGDHIMHALLRRADVVPDAYCRIETAEDRYNVFVELDRGTETVQSLRAGAHAWDSKVRAYRTFYEQGGYEALFQTSDLRILVVTTSRKRADHLKAATEQAWPSSRFWFTTMEQVAQRDVLTDPIWEVAGYEGLHPLKL